jgi:hypothetical protein
MATALTLERQPSPHLGLGCYRQGCEYFAAGLAQQRPATCNGGCREVRRGKVADNVLGLLLAIPGIHQRKNSGALERRHGDDERSRSRSKFSKAYRTMLPVSPESLFGLIPLLNNPSLNLLGQVGSFASGQRREMCPAPKSGFIELLESQLFRTSHSERPQFLLGCRTCGLIERHIVPRCPLNSRFWLFARYAVRPALFRVPTLHLSGTCKVSASQPTPILLPGHVVPAHRECGPRHLGPRSDS